MSEKSRQLGKVRMDLRQKFEMSDASTMDMQMLVKWSPNETMPFLNRRQADATGADRATVQQRGHTAGQAGGVLTACSKAKARLSMLSYSLRVRKMAECVSSMLPKCCALCRGQPQ